LFSIVTFKVYDVPASSSIGPLTCNSWAPSPSGSFAVAVIAAPPESGVK